MSSLRGPLDQLLQKDTEFNRDSKCEEAFNRVKAILTSDQLLTHFNPELPIRVAADASQYGIGATISHICKDGKEKVIEHASRTLTPAERNYSQIEKEGLALVYAVKKFHRMLYGRKFTLLTDHRPLLAIFSNNRGIPVHAANRLQRWALILLAYNFNLQYISTEKFGQADVLSRLIADYPRDEDEIVIAQMKMESDLIEIMQASIQQFPVTTSEVKKATKQDPTLSKVREFLQLGWPKHPPSEATAKFYQKRQWLNEIDGVLIYNDRVIIPNILRQRILEYLHEGDPGMNRMKAKARQHVYWFGINEDIERFVRSCEACAQTAKMPVKATLQPWKAETQLWTRIHIDFAGPVDGEMHLIVVDAYSKWPIVFTMHSTTAQETVKALEYLVNQYGLPRVIVSDNGVQFTSQLFKQFCKQNGIDHIRSAPYHPQSNGQAERFVDTFKRALKKHKIKSNVNRGSKSIGSFLFAYRSTPNASIENKTPAELFLGRKLFTHLDLARPQPRIQPSCQSSYQKQMCDQFNRHHGAKATILRVGDRVQFKLFLQGERSWKIGQIIGHLGKVNFKIKYDGHKTCMRHANQIRKIKPSFEESIELDVPEPEQSNTPASTPFVTPVSTPAKQDRPSQKEAPQPKAVQETSLRRSNRVIKPPTIMVMDPSKKSYSYREHKVDFKKC